jgi:hypothetical protein
MSIDTNPGFRQLGRCAPVAVNSGLRPETRCAAGDLTAIDTGGVMVFKNDRI